MSQHRLEFTVSDDTVGISGEVMNKYSPESLVLHSEGDHFHWLRGSRGVPNQPTELIIETTPVRIHIFL